MFPEIDKEKTGDRIRFFMELRGLTVKDVCKALSLGCVQAVYKWMDGVNLPSLDNIYCLSILFQVPIDARVVEKPHQREWSIQIFAQSAYSVTIRKSGIMQPHE